MHSFNYTTREARGPKQPVATLSACSSLPPLRVWCVTMDPAVDRRIENDENCNATNAKRAAMRRTLKPSRPKDGRKKFGRRNKRPQSGKPRRRVHFSMDADVNQTRTRPHTAGAKRRHMSPYSSNQGVQTRHPDLQKYAKYADKSNIPEPVRSVGKNNNTKLTTAPGSNINNVDTQTSSQVSSPRMFRRNGMSVKTAAEAYCLELEKRVKRQISILAHTRKEVKTVKLQLKTCKDKNRKMMRRSAFTIAELKKRLQVATKRPSPHLVRMRKERDTVLIELKRLGLLNEKLKAEKQQMEKDFEIEREYFREEIEKLSRANISAQHKHVMGNTKVDETRDTSSVAKEKIPASPNQWKAFQATEV